MTKFCILKDLNIQQYLCEPQISGSSSFLYVICTDCLTHSLPWGVNATDIDVQCVKFAYVSVPPTCICWLHVICKTGVCCTITLISWYDTVKRYMSRVMPWLRWLVTGLSLQNPRSVRVGFVVDKVALGQVFLQVLQFSPISNILPVLHTHSFRYYRRSVVAIDSIVK